MSYNCSLISISTKSDKRDITSVEISILSWAINYIKDGKALKGR